MEHMACSVGSRFESAPFRNFAPVASVYKQWKVEEVAVRSEGWATCQLVQHVRKQLLAGRVENEEFLEQERYILVLDSIRNVQWPWSRSGAIRWSW